MAKSSIVVEINHEQFMAIEIAYHNAGAETIRYAIHQLPPEGINPAWLKSLWHQEHFSHHQIVFSIPGTLVNYQTLKLPRLSLAEMDNLVRMELAGVNNPQNELYKIIGRQNREQFSQVTVAVISNQISTEYLELFKKAGLEVLWSGLRTRGIQNYLNFNRGFFEDTGGEISFFDFGETKTEFGVVRDEQVIYRRSLRGNVNNLMNNEDQDSLDDFLEELRLSIAAYQSEFQLQLPKRIEVFGTISVTDRFSRELHKQFGLSLHISDRTNLTGVLTRQHTSSLAVAVGLALDQLGVYPHGTLPVFTLEQERASIRRKGILSISGMIIAGFLIIGGVALFLNARLEKEKRVRQWLAAKRPALNRLHRVENQTKTHLAKIDQLEEWLSGQGRELEFLLMLQKYLPVETRITDLIIEDGKIKDLSGVTPSVSLLLEKLQKSPELRNFKLKSTITTDRDGREQFRLEGKIETKELLP